MLIGAAAGVFELAWVFERDDPSVVRRARWFVAFAAIQGGSTLGVLFLVAAIIGRIGRRFAWKTAAGDGWPVRAGVLVGAVVFGALTLWFGQALTRGDGNARFGAALGFLAAGALVAFAVARLGARWTRSFRRRSPLVSRVAVGGAALAVGLSAGWVVARTPDSTGTSASAKRPTGATAREDAPNIVLILIDTLRADALGSYGAAGDPTPAMDWLANEGVLFERAVAPSSWTLPSIASILTSTMPVDHGLNAFTGVLRGELEVLPELLANAGYSCRAIVANELVSRRRGFARGYELYDTYGYAIEGSLTLSKLFDRLVFLCGPARSFGMSKRPFLTFVSGFPFIETRMTHYLYDEDITDRVLRYAAEPDQRPIFLYVHYLAPHSPYLEHPLRAFPSQPSLEEANRGDLLRLYGGEVTYTDAIVGELLDGLGELTENAIIVVTSDHGEEFWEHGRMLHGNGVFQEAVHVPLLFRGPGFLTGARVEYPVSLIDIAPTLLDFAGVAVPDAFAGGSLRHALTGEGEERDRAPVLTELLAKHANQKFEYYGILDGDRKVIRRVSLQGEPAAVETYDLAADPGETTPLDLSIDALLQRLEEEEGKRTHEIAPGVDELDESERTALRALGYVE